MELEREGTIWRLVIGRVERHWETSEAEAAVLA